MWRAAPVELIARLRELMPRTPFLLPGYGAQGAGAADVIAAFDGDGQGCLVTASRSITFPWVAEHACPQDWEERVAAAAQAMRDDIEKARSGGA